MKNKLNNKKGFVRLIVVLIIILVLLSLVGIDPVFVWNNFFRPIFGFIGNIILSVANWLTSVLRYLWVSLGL